MEVGFSKETVDMFEERVGRWQTTLLLHVALWGVIFWALMPPVVGAFFVLSFIVGGVDWERASNFGMIALIASGVISLLSIATALVIISLTRRSTRRALSDLHADLHSIQSGLEQVLEVQDKSMEKIAEVRGTLRRKKIEKV